MLCLVVALDCEARPFIARYRLKAEPRAVGFRVYRDADTALIVAGVGRTLGATATAYLQGLLQLETDAAWVNIGVAGHRDYPIGALYRAHTVIDSASGKRWHPPLVSATPYPSATVRSVDKPETEYPDDALYDMEAAGFYPIACRFSTSELVQVCKIVSDNLATPVHHLTAADIETLVADAADALVAGIEQSRTLAGEVAKLAQAPPGFDALTNRHHFTVSERRRLREGLRRLRLLEPAALDNVERFTSASDALHWLDARIAANLPRIAQTPA